MTNHFMDNSLHKQQIADLKSWAWLRSGALNKETKGFLMAAQTK